MKSRSILVVDDEPNNFDVIETLLSIGDENYDLSYVSSGLEALDVLDAINPDLILLDVMMPEVDGIEICQRIKSMPQWKSTPIIMVTALTSREDLARSLNLGADDFISKPINALELRARVNSMLRIKQNYDEVQKMSRLQEETIQTLEYTLEMLQGNLINRLAHELNTPIQGIIGTIDLLKFYIDRMKKEEIQETLESASQSALRLASLNQKLLVFLELDLAALKQRPTDRLTTTLFSQELISALTSVASKYDRSGDLIIDQTDVEVCLSQRYLLILMTELVDNALKFSEPGTSIRIFTQQTDDQCHVFVEDAGRGMPQEGVETVGTFMQFEREKYENQGLGLGLSLVQKIMALNGGEILLKSLDQEGTVVQLAFPQAIKKGEAVALN